MNKSYIPVLSQAIRENARYLQSAYLTLQDYKYEIYNLYLRKEEDLCLEADLNDLVTKYTNYQAYVAHLEKEQRNRKTLLKSLMRERDSQIKTKELKEESSKL